MMGRPNIKIVIRQSGSVNEKAGEWVTAEQKLSSLVDTEEYAMFVKFLKRIVQDNKVRAILQADDTVNALPVRVVNIPAARLQPTQNEIGVKESLDNLITLQYKDTLALALQGKKKGITFGPTPIVTFDGKFVIDGHHRWSQAYAANPRTSLKCIDFKRNMDVEEPEEMLRVVQMAIAAMHGDVPQATSLGSNLLEFTPEQTRKHITGLLQDKTPGQVQEIVDFYRENGAIEGDEEIGAVVDLIVDNVEMMNNTGPSEDASERTYMPQVDRVTGDPADVVKALAAGNVNVVDPALEDLLGPKGAKSVRKKAKKEGPKNESRSYREPYGPIAGGTNPKRGKKGTNKGIRRLERELVSTALKSDDLEDEDLFIDDPRDKTRGTAGSRTKDRGWNDFGDGRIDYRKYGDFEFVERARRK